MRSNSELAFDPNCWGLFALVRSLHLLPIPKEKLRDGVGPATFWACRRAEEKKEACKETLQTQVAETSGYAVNLTR